jgi:WD40 repeat protein
MTVARPVLFLAFANDRVDSTRFLRSLNRELKEVREALVDEDGLQRDGGARWETHDVPDATIDELVTGLGRYRDRIALFHYGGHAGDYALLLETADGKAALAQAGGLAQLLGTQRGLQCVFLNGCSTKGHVDALLAAGVPAVIATRHEIEDDLALDFARHFYRAIATGASLGRAFSEAEGAVRLVVGADPSDVATTRTVDTSDASAPSADRVPWELHVAPGADVVRTWSLGAAAGDPLFGLPPLPERPLPSSPFRHLRWFTSDDAELFFGRGREIHALHDSVTAPDASPVTLLFGQSGSGKSSLLDAGLTPRLAVTHDVRYARRDETLGLTGTLQKALGTPSERPIVAIVDQIEEAYTKPRKEEPAELETFVAVLATLWKQSPSLRVVLAFRKEWLAEVARRLAEARVPYQQVFLERLDRAGVVDAITGPSRVPRLRRQYGLDIVGDDFATIVADDLLADGGSAVAPTLQVLLSKLWEQPSAQRNGRVVFDVDLYQRLKNDGILLSDFFDGQLALLSAWNREVVTSGLTLDVLQAHTTTLVTARARTFDELSALYGHVAVLKELLEQCRQRYLLLDAPNGTTLAHDTLAPLVRRRFELSVLPGQRARRVTEARAPEWGDGQTGRTLDRYDLGLVERGRDGMRSWTPDETRLVAASRIACAGEVRARRLRRGAAVGGALLVAALGTLAGIAGLRARRDASRAERAVVVSAAVAQPDRLDGALLLATLDGVPEPLGGLQSALAVGGQAVPSSVVDHGDIVDPVLSSDGRVLVAGVVSDRPRMWSLDGALASGAGLPIGRVGDTLYVQGVNGDGTRLLATSGGRARSVVMLATDGSNAPFALPTTCQWGGGGFALGGQLLWEGCREGELRMWRIDGTPRLVASRKMEGQVGAVSEDGRRAVVVFESGDGDIQLRVMDLERRTRLAAYRMPTGIGAMRFTHDGASILIGGEDGIVRRISARQSPDVAELIGHTGPIEEIALSADGTRIATVSRDRTVRVWSGSDSLAPLVLPHGAVPRSAAFTARGDSLVTVADDGSTRRWPLDGAPAARRLAGDVSPARFVAFSDDGRRVLAITSDERVIVRGVDGRVPPIVIHRAGWDSTNAVRAAAFTADGRRVVTIAADDTVRMWSAERADASPVTLGTGPNGDLVAASFSRDGQRVATLSESDSRILVRSVDGFGDSLAIPMSGSTMVVALSPDGRGLVADGTRDSASLARAARYWPPSTSAKPMLLALPDFAASFAFSADGQQVAATAGRGVYLWTLETGASRRLPDAPAAVVDVRFSPDGETVAVAASDSAVRLHRVDRGGAPLVIHTSEGIRSIAFSPDGALLATAGDGGVRLWRIRWPDVIHALAGATTACLGEEQRRAFLAQTADVARAGWRACERKHGRTP